MFGHTGDGFEAVVLSAPGRALLNSLIARSDKGRAIVVMPYHWPDLDGVVAALLVQHVLSTYFGFTRCTAGYAEQPQIEAEIWLASASQPLGTVSLSGEEDIIVVDTCRLQDLPSSVSSTAVIGVIDHHMEYAASQFENACMQIEPVGAATTLAGELLVSLPEFGVDGPDNSKGLLSAELARGVYLAIATSTVGFTAACTTPRDRFIADKMLDFLGFESQVGLGLYEDLLKAKTDRIEANIGAAVRWDLPTYPDTVNDEQVIGAELQVLNATEFIGAHYETCMSELRLLTTEKQVTYSWLLICGYQDRQSILVSPDQRPIDLFLNKVRGIPEHGSLEELTILFLSSMVTRKDVFKRLRTMKKGTTEHPTTEHP